MDYSKSQKMDPKTTQLTDELFKFFDKYSTYIGFIIMGLVGRFSYDLLRNKHFTWPYILGCAGISLIGGYTASVYIFQNYPEKAPLLVPLITMTSNNLVSAIMTIDYKALIKKDWRGAFDILFKK